ncbi:anti-sigma factor [Nocardioides sp. Leaf307]|uniref:anti-sigma factor n=1 Tax=Nocardioides sp. Leaf307 TaxID=1736331 RepID=UPI0007027BDD|nr:anti-sigma factor [Nocardioides sp. Leaf307]KQQ43562.1 anti-sigma factor [Nocardioides sp. Leaf307]
MSQHGPTIDPIRDRSDVELRLPADGAYVSVLRTTTASLAARLDFTIDDIEDLRIAVGEACALVLPEADAGADLVGRFYLRPAELTVSVSVGAADAGEPDRDSFAWQVLDTLASEVGVRIAEGELAVALTLRSTHLGAGL